MFTIASAPSRLSQRLSGARARWQSTAGDNTTRRTSRGETFAIGLGCDGWKSYQH